MSTVVSEPVRRARHRSLLPGPAVLLLCGLAVASCSKCGDAGPTKDAAPPVLSASSEASPSSSAPPVRDAATSSLDAEAGGAVAAPLDAGPSACRLVYGPAEQPFRGPAALVVTPSELRLVANDSGKPRTYPIPISAPPPPGAPSVVPPAPSSFASMRWPPCEIAGRWAYCQAAGGLVYRTTLGATDTKEIAKSRASTRIAAAPLGSDHAVVATLDVRRTTEGDMIQAFITLDDGETERLSEEGAGATVVRLVPRGAGAVALYIDARTAMLPVHARPIAMAAPASAGAKRTSHLTLGEDAVVFVGGPPERGIEISAAAFGRSVFALLPMARETTEFGMAALSIAEQPKDAVEPVWSLYPNGLDPAPIGATISTAGSSSSAADAAAAGFGWVARVRPSDREVGSPRVLELGRIDAAGVFSSLGALASGKRITDIAVALDSHRSLWVLYGDSNATWLERRVCP